MSKRVTILTSGHLAGTPRMLKAADALHEAGYRVRVVCAEHVDWAIAASNQIRASRAWKCGVVDWHPSSGKTLYRWSRYRHRLFRVVPLGLFRRRLPLGVLARTACRVAPELLQATIQEDTDLIYAGTSGALAVAAIAARKLRVPYALDLEDYHPGEKDVSQRGATERAIIEIERRVIPRAAFVSTSSTPIADAYEQDHGIRPHVIHNVFPLPATVPEFRRVSAETLRLIWFSQQIGPGRGLEELVDAAIETGETIELGLIGSVTPFAKELVDRTHERSKTVTITLLGHFPPDELVEVCRRWDIGCALEPGFSPNNRMALSNKISTYLIAGLAIVASGTPGHEELTRDLGGDVIQYNPGDIGSLACGLQRYARQSELLIAAKRASWLAAVRRWHWDHPQEKGKLLSLVHDVIGAP